MQVAACRITDAAHIGNHFALLYPLAQRYTDVAATHIQGLRFCAVVELHITAIWLRILLIPKHPSRLFQHYTSAALCAEFPALDFLHGNVIVIYLPFGRHAIDEFRRRHIRRQLGHLPCNNSSLSQISSLAVI